MENAAGSLPLHRSESESEEPVDRLSAVGAGSVLPLATALGSATGVAAALRDRHGEIPVPTNDWSDGVRVGLRGAVLDGDEHSSQPSGQDSDIAAFGDLLYELMTGSRPPRDLSRVVLPRARVGAEGVRSAATRLALRCLAGERPNVQRILTEMRLYSLMARQSAASVHAKAKPQARLSGTGALRGAWHADGGDQTELLCDAECPACGGSFVHRSRPRTRFEYLLLATGISLKRCHRCLYRYVAILGIVFPKRTPEFKEPFG